MAVRSLCLLHLQLLSSLPKSSPSPSSPPSSFLWRSNWKKYQSMRFPTTHPHAPASSKRWRCCGSWRIRCMSQGTEGGPKMPARLAQMQQLLEAREADSSDSTLPIPKVTLDHVTLNFARSGGPGGQNVNKVNTKVDMRFKVNNALWLPERVRSKLLQMEKNRINSDGELVVTSTKTRTQQGNIEDALSKLQSLIDAAAYVPPPPSAETKKRIQKLARVENEKRLTQKKQAGMKKSARRNKGSWD